VQDYFNSTGRKFYAGKERETVRWTRRDLLCEAEIITRLRNREEEERVERSSQIYLIKIDITREIFHKYLNTVRQRGQAKYISLQLILQEKFFLIT